jgi:hypothetical protein
MTGDTVLLQKIDGSSVDVRLRLGQARNPEQAENHERGQPSDTADDKGKR